MCENYNLTRNKKQSSMSYLCNILIEYYLHFMIYKVVLCVKMLLNITFIIVISTTEDNIYF